jgi:hypothetical protein
VAAAWRAKAGTASAFAQAARVDSTGISTSLLWLHDGAIPPELVVTGRGGMTTDGGWKS